MSKSAAVAIVGIGGLFPDAPDLEQFWKLVRDGKTAVREVPTNRWQVAPADIYDPEVGKPDHLYSTKGCFIENCPQLPELADLDPLFHLLVTAGRQAFADANTKELALARTGVIIGNLALPTETASKLSHALLGCTFAEQLTGKTPSDVSIPLPTNRFVAGLPAGILAQSLGLGGVTSTLDAACASSLYAIKLAIDELLSHRADAMLCGGVSRPDPLYTQVGFSQLRALSKQGICAPFDADGDGLVVGEGAGIFMLKRLDDALAANDHIYGVIRAVGISNDIGGSLLAPSSEGQLRAMEAAYKLAGWQPEDVDLIECHATGTPVGDAVEVASLRQLWQQGKTNADRCVIGSVKSNIGHLLTAAGAAALTKVLLAMAHETLPPTAGFKTPQPAMELDKSPFQVLSSAKPWQRRADNIPRRAAVSAFGFGGINAHLLVEEWLPALPDDATVAVKSKTKAEYEPIAIVGMDASFGHWQGLSALVKHLYDDFTPQPAPPENWYGLQQSNWFRQTHFATKTTEGWFINEINCSAAAFRIPPKELAEMLPQQLLMLQTAANALADAGESSANPQRSGVLIGIALDLHSTDFCLRWDMEQKAKAWTEQLGLQLTAAELKEWTAQLRDAIAPPLTANRTMGALGSIVASRIAREFRFGGAGFTMSAEENSGIRALETAVRLLQQGELEQALVGAVELTNDPRAAVGYQNLQQSDGKGEKILLGEGACAFVLKRLADAKRDGNHVYAIIKGIGTAQGSTDQAVAIARNIAITEAETEQTAYPCFDATTLLGHSGAASGLASVMAAAIALEQRIIPPKACQQSLSQAPYFWLRNRGEGARMAGVSTTSVDGSCSHLLLQEYEEDQQPAGKTSPLPAIKDQLFPITGNNAEQLSDKLEQLKNHCQNLTEQAFHDLAAMLQQNYDSQAVSGLSLIATNKEQLQTLLPWAERAVSLGTVPNDLPPALRERIFYNAEPLADQGKIAFVFPGSGSHYSGMGQELLCRWSAVLHRQDQDNLRLKDQFQPQLFWNDTADNKQLNNQQAVIFGQVAIGCAISDLVQLFGIRPAAMIGYSLGETAALFASRAWHKRDAMLERMENSTLFSADLAGECRAARTTWQLAEDETVNWGIGLLTVSADQVRQTIAEMKKSWHSHGKSSSKPLAERVYLLINNCNDECVAGGDADALAELVKQLGCSFFPLQGVTTVHCEVAKAVSNAYRKLHLFETNPPDGVSFYSCAAAAAYQPDKESAANAILSQAINSIDYQATVEAAWQDGVRIFLEMGPGNSCSRMINRILEDRPHLARSVCFDGQEPGLILLRFLAALIAERVPLDLTPLASQQPLPEEEPAANGKMLQMKIGSKAYNLPPLPQKVDATAEEGANLEPAQTIVWDAPKNEPVKTTFSQQESALITNQFLQQFSTSRTAEYNAHDAFLRLSSSITNAMAEAIALEARLCNNLDLHPAEVNHENGYSSSRPEPAKAVQPAQKPERVTKPCLFDRDDCLEFATGSATAIFGSSFAELDSFPTRVRLPDEPLMLVDRILALEGEPCSMTSGRVVTEHDILPGAWYLDGGRIPTCIAVESGQADLLLSGYLGADFITRGLAVYRLLDAVVTFHRGLPEPGKTIRYDIRIDHFFRQGDTWLFRFNFDATVDEQPMLTMRDGCAGFFSAQELEAGKGIVRPAVDLRPVSGTIKPQWKELVTIQGKEAYSAEQLDQLRAGNLAACFGADFANLPVNKPLTIPGGMMRLVHRVLELDPSGGHYGLGQIKAEADIAADDWFITCHFVDDRVMPGTLMYECCMHSLRIMLLRMGFVADLEDGVVWEPVPGVASRLRCRGQVLETTKVAGYEVAIREIGYNPEPYVLVDALMYADGKPIVEITNMSCRLSGTNKAKLEKLWQKQRQADNRETDVSDSQKKPAIYTKQQIMAFSNGKPSEAFGEHYQQFDSQRKIARLPGPPFQFLDRVTAVQGEPWLMQAGAYVETQYDLPGDAWFFAADRQPLMPFCILLEIALQPCGWLAAYVGSALTSKQDLSFRNLGGKAVQHRMVTPQSGTLTCTAKLTKAVSSGGMVIQEYDFTVSDQQGLVYSGETMFGFFSAAALGDQVGIRDADICKPDAGEIARAASLPYPLEQPFPDTKLRMIDQIDLYIADGGSKGLGFIQGSKKVNPQEWFFDAHFYQDPVTPGSLGLESFLQLLRFAANERWGNNCGSNLFAITNGSEHNWLYRGQVIPANTMVVVTAWITEINDNAKQLTADGYLSVDGKVIYRMSSFTVQLQSHICK